MGEFLFNSLIGAGLTLLASWIIMLLLGVAHGTNPGVPALGYITTVLLVFAASFVFALEKAKGVL
jgi:hypothetical protein